MAVSAISNGCVARRKLFMGAIGSVEFLLQNFFSIAVIGVFPRNLLLGRMSILELDRIAQILQLDPQVQKIRQQQGVDKAQEYIKTVFFAATRSQEQFLQPQSNQQYQPKPEPGFELC